MRAPEYFLARRRRLSTWLVIIRLSMIDDRSGGVQDADGVGFVSEVETDRDGYRVFHKAVESTCTARAAPLPSHLILF